MLFKFWINYDETSRKNNYEDLRTNLFWYKFLNPSLSISISELQILKKKTQSKI